MSQKMLLKEKERPRDFECERFDIDFCSKLMTKAIKYKETENQLKLVLRERDKYRSYFATLLNFAKSSMEPRKLIANIFKNQLSVISEIKAGYIFETKRVISFWIFIEKDNWEAEERIYEAYGELLDFFPDQEIYLRLLKLYERKPEELLPHGFRAW